MPSYSICTIPEQSWTEICCMFMYIMKNNHNRGSSENFCACYENLCKCSEIVRAIYHDLYYSFYRIIISLCTKL